MKKVLLAASAVSVAIASSALEAQVNVIATTTGCFYTTPDAACSVGSASTNLNGLISYLGGSFNVTVGPGANHNFTGDVNDNIGSLTLSGSPATLGDSFLRVFVSFTSPALGTPNDIAVADFIFRDNSGDPRLEVLFDETYHLFQYGANPLQMFKFRGAEGSPTVLRQGDPLTYLGFRVDCVLAGTAGCLAPSPTVPSTVPEPSTYALMAAGLAAVFGIARRRKQQA